MDRRGRGYGPWALVTWCRYPVFSLHSTREDAEGSKQFVDRFGCGGQCVKQHDIYDLREEVKDAA